MKLSSNLRTSDYKTLWMYICVAVATLSHNYLLLRWKIQATRYVSKIAVERVYTCRIYAYVLVKPFNHGSWHLPHILHTRWNNVTRNVSTWQMAWRNTRPRFPKPPTLNVIWKHFWHKLHNLCSMSTYCCLINILFSIVHAFLFLYI